jgi:hypothetical protein
MDFVPNYYCGWRLRSRCDGREMGNDSEYKLGAGGADQFYLSFSYLGSRAKMCAHGAGNN